MFYIALICYNKVKLQDPVGKKNHRCITISKDNYEKMIELGDMTSTFDSVLTNLMKQANVKSSAAAAKGEDKKD